MVRCVVSIMTMVLSKSQRRLVAGTVAVLFLACQAAVVVLARAVDLQQPTAASSSCHEPAQEDGKTTGNRDCEVNCQSQLNSTAQFANVYAVIDLPAITVHIDRAIIIANSAPLTEPPMLRIASPPLLVLHSRLRN